MEEQMRMLCSVWKDAWQGMVMAEIFWKEGTLKASCGVHVKEGRLIRLSACTDGGELSMVLLPFQAGKYPRKGREGEPWRLFTAEEVHHFSDALGDHNAIHQGSQPIVSGFQLLLSLVAMYPGKAVRLRFHHPVRAGEMVYLKKEGDQLLGYTDTLCFAGEWQRKGSRE